MVRAKKRKLINAVKTEYKGIQFDSLSEKEFFVHLESKKEEWEVQDIVCHPTFFVIKPFEVTCYKCKGSGKELSKATGNPINCKRCAGTGKKSRRATEYTPDFMLIYKNGDIDYFDVKSGKFTNERFPLIKKGFEKVMGQELIVVYQDQKSKKWIFK